MLPLPSFNGYCPHFNPIENCWGLTKKELNEDLSVNKSNRDANKQRLWEEVKAYLDGLDNSYIQALIDSFPTRMEIAIQPEATEKSMCGLLRKDSENDTAKSIFWDKNDQESKFNRVKIVWDQLGLYLASARLV